MNLNLTVRKKIIGGFSILVILLIFTSITSLSNLNTINNATKQQGELAIPTLSISNALANHLAQIETLTLSGYYQKDVTKLNSDRNEYNEINKTLDGEFKRLKVIVKDESGLLSNLRKVDSVYASLQSNIDQVFNQRQSSIENLSSLDEQVYEIEERADDAATVMLDLADNDLADTTLQRAVSLGEQLETLLDGIVTSAFEFKDVEDKQTADIIANQITGNFESAQQVIREIENELAVNNIEGISEEIIDTEQALATLLSGSQSIFQRKDNQINANGTATSQLAEAKSNIRKATDILNQQINLANQTADRTGEEVSDSVSTGNTITTIIMVGSIVIAVGIGWITLISITKPLSRVNDILQTVASGDLSRKLDDSGKDEFAQLSRNCNTLIYSLRSLINGIVSRSTQLATASEQTSAVTAQATTAIEEQRAQVEQAASATTEMSSTSHSVLSSANDALGEIKQADDEAERVKHISNRNRSTIEQLAQEVEDASQVINKLQQDSASIGGILDVIRGIAEQTNLLALNAAIEAARAGEQGRGFAVVADEVRTLASRTQESTQEIQNMIEVLQSGAEQAVTVMDTGKKKAAECVNQSEEAGKALETITHAVHEAFDRSSQIASAAEEQSAVAHEISENLESIVAIAEQTTAGSKQTAESSSEVARLAEELQLSVQEFKL